MNNKLSIIELKINWTLTNSPESKKAPPTKRQEPIPAPVPSYPPASQPYPGIVQPEPPNKILFVQNLPDNATTESVSQYFAQ
jgi:hypothetical protein